MTIKAEKVGRDLVITPFEGADPYVIRPLPGSAGVQVTDMYLKSTTGQAPAEELLAVLLMSVDGARENAITGRWEPLPEAERVNYNRIGRELSQAESEDVLMPAFFFQTVLGMSGVKAYVSAGGGVAGALKATGALSQRLGLYAQRTSPKASVTD